jgi:DNA polymerase-3 subunit epsilon
MTTLSLTRPLACFDLETTGLQIGKDRIIEIAIVKLLPDGSKQTFHSKVHPEIPIPLEISEITGIYDVDVLEAPKLKEIAQQIIDFVGDSDLTGYNCNKFDIPFIIEDFNRVGFLFDISQKQIIDVQNIFHKMEPRNLSAAYQFYCNKELINAHSALADTEATLDILLAQLERYPTLERTVNFLGEFSHVGPRTFDFARRIGIAENGEYVFNFGKHKGKLVKDVFKQEPGYYSWIMNGDFAQDTKNKFTLIKQEMQKLS